LPVFNRHTVFAQVGNQQVQETPAAGFDREWAKLCVLAVARHDVERGSVECSGSNIAYSSPKKSSAQLIARFSSERHHQDSRRVELTGLNAPLDPQSEHVSLTRSGRCAHQEPTISAHNGLVLFEGQALEPAGIG
jgi:hypothetical protein